MVASGFPRASPGGINTLLGGKKKEASHFCKASYKLAVAATRRAQLASCARSKGGYQL